MTINDVLFFDTETTGIPDRSAKWDTDFADYPHVVQMAWIHGCKVENHIIRPDGWEIPDDTVAVHGITTDYALEHGEPFAAVVDMFIQDCHDAARIAADAVKKFGAAPETAGNGPILDAKQKDDKLPIQSAKAPEIENFIKIGDAAADLLDQDYYF